MRNKIGKNFYIILYFIFFIIIISLLVGISIPAKSKIANIINAAISPYNIEMKALKIRLLPDRGIYLSLRLEDVYIQREQNDLLSCDSVSIDLHPLNLLQKKVETKIISLNKCKILPFLGTETKEVDFNVLNDTLLDHKSLLARFSFSLKNFNLPDSFGILQDYFQGGRVNLLNINIHMDEEEGHTAYFTLQTLKSNIEIETKWDINENGALELFFDADNALQVAQDFVKNLNVVENNVFTRGLLILSKNGYFEKFVLQAKGGGILNFINKSYALENLEFEAHCAGKCDRIPAVFKSKINNIDVDAKLLMQDDILQIHFNTSDHPLQYFIGNWPDYTASDNIKNWLKNKAQGNFVIEGDIEYNVQKHNYDYAILASFNNGELRYYEPAIPIKNAHGNVNFSRENINLNVKDANVLNSNLKLQAHIFYPENQKANLNANALLSGSAMDQIVIFNSHLSHPLASINVVGDAESKINLKMPLKDSVQPSDLALDISIKAKDLEAIILQAKSINQLSLDASYKNGELSAKGKAYYKKNIPFSFELNQHVEGSEAFDPSKIKITFSNSIEELRKYSPNIPDFISGNITAQFGVKKDLIDMHADLLDTAIDIPFVIKKARGQPGTISLVIEEDKDISKWKDIDLFLGHHLHVNGYITVNNQSSAKNKYIGKLELYKTNFGILFLDINEKGINFHADRIDISNENFKDLFKDNGKNKSNFWGSINELELKNNVRMYNTQINYHCNQDCTFKLQGHLDHNDTTIILKEPNKIYVNSHNAGQFLNGLALYRKLKGGILTLDLQKQENGQYQGVFQINKFHAIKNNFFVKLLTIPSLTLSPQAVQELLGNKGIWFENFNCPIRMEGKKAVFDKCLAKGYSLSIILDGEIDLEHYTVKINGVLVPENIVNNILGSVPVVGKALLGSGIIATNFSIEGDIENPRTMINPLSTLTPGFIRGIFDIFRK